MKAIICTKYGSPEVLQLNEVKKPTPQDNEVLIKVHAASVTAADGMMRLGTPRFSRLFLGLTKPKVQIPGTGFAGVIEAVGEKVTRFKPGDEVFGESVFGQGTNAEYFCMTEAGLLTIKPANITHSEAAPVCDGALTSMSFLTDIGNIRRGQHVLINGASGSLGTAAVQLAKHYGANVTGVCSTANIDMVKSLGADQVIDYTKEDFTHNSQAYDIIYDTVGKSSFSRCKAALTQRGVFISPVLSLPLLLQMVWTSMVGSKKAKFSATGIRPVPELKVLFEEIKSLIEAGKIKSVIDKTYALAQTADAHRYVEKGHKKGNVVLAI